MTTIRKIFNFSSLGANVITGFVLGLFFPFSVWVIEFAYNRVPVNFSSFTHLHRVHISLWFIDVVPILVSAFIYYYTKKRDDEARVYENELIKRKERIDKIALFAHNIGTGDYSNLIDVEDDDDVLAKSLLVMRDNLLTNYQKESKESWIAEGKEIISGILRMHTRVEDLAYEVLVNLINYINAVQGAFYLYHEESGKIVNLATYAFNRKRFGSQEFQTGKGLIGQCVYEMDIIYRTEIPEDYVSITSGILGDKKPQSILIVPLISNEKLQGIIEFASLQNEIPELTITFLKELGEIIARTIFNLRINHKTEKLLQDAQQMTEELKRNEDQLKHNAEDMQATQNELKQSNEQLESKIKEVENGQIRLNSLLENASEIITIYDINLNLTFQSPSVKNILGYSTEEITGGKFYSRLIKKGELEFRNMFQQLLNNPAEPITIEYTFQKKDGQEIFLETTGINLLNDSVIKGYLLNSQDITEKKRAEKEERMKTRMQSLSENSFDMILRLSLTGEFYYVNPVVEKYIGYSNKTMINMTYTDLNLPVVLKNYFDKSIKQIKKTSQKMIDEITFYKLEDRISYIMSFDAIPEFNENELETILFVGHDISETKRIAIEIQEKNKKIEESINYAEHIQSSIIPTNKLIKNYLPKSFVYYKPREAVSGDFPWFCSKDDNIYIAVVDCTGHGVPGAMLSFIAYFLLNNIVDHDVDLTASDICNKLHEKVRNTLRQDQEEAIFRDGMDIALCKINLKQHELQFSGAHRPLYVVRKNELTEYKGTRKAIGGIPLSNKVEDPFSNNKINILRGDKIFFFSDGLPDQLGGPERKKYSAQRIRNLIINNYQFSMPEFHEFFSNDYDEWIGNNKQIDDILVIGIEF